MQACPYCGHGQECRARRQQDQQEKAARHADEMMAKKQEAERTRPARRLAAIEKSKEKKRRATVLRGILKNAADAGLLTEANLGKFLTTIPPNCEIWLRATYVNKDDPRRKKELDSYLELYRGSTKSRLKTLERHTLWRLFGLSRRRYLNQALLRFFDNAEAEMGFVR